MEQQIRIECSSQHPYVPRTLHFFTFIQLAWSARTVPAQPDPANREGIIILIRQYDYLIRNLFRQCVFQQFKRRPVVSIRPVRVRVGPRRSPVGHKSTDCRRWLWQSVKFCVACHGYACLQFDAAGWDQYVEKWWMEVDDDFVVDLCESFQLQTKLITSNYFGLQSHE